MLKIRLQRGGKVHSPFYRIVVTEHTAPPQSKIIEKVGTYNPTTSPKEVSFDEERIAYWMAVGAKPSATVEALIKKNCKLLK